MRDGKEVWLFGCCAAVLFLTAPTPAVRATGQPRVVISIVVSNNDSPVKILEIQPPEMAGGAPLVKLSNATDKMVKRVLLAALVRSASNGLDLVQGHSGEEFDDRPIDAQQTGWAHAGAFVSPNLMRSVGSLHSSCGTVFTTVMGIEFVDGSDWMSREHSKNKMLERAMKERNVELCSPNADAQAMVEELGNSGFMAGRPDGTKIQKEADGFSFTCSLMRKDPSTVVGHCPF